jgi:teichuronic acid biosynthesis glycosyltransferase TuaG
VLTSVIIPCYNAESTVRRAIQSVLVQEGCEVELLVIDDASTDGTRQVLLDMQAEDSGIKTVLLTESRGAGNARNAGIELARGEMLAFLDADDTWSGGKLARQVNYMITNEVDFSCTYYSRNDERASEKKVVKSPAVAGYSLALKCNPIGTSTVVVRSRLLGKMRFSEMARRQDYLLWLQILEKGNDVHCLPFVGTEYLCGTGNSLSSNRLKSLKYNWRVLRSFEIGIIPAVYYIVNQAFKSRKKNLGQRWW